ncbi:hypothetical protein GJAV_G00048860 [Gymnothorax javanicus]|nr:hypothetical protein GJAV_G00048860 [Gymnothorax javanicus]
MVMGFMRSTCLYYRSLPQLAKGYLRRATVLVSQANSSKAQGTRRKGLGGRGGFDAIKQGHLCSPSVLGLEMWC